MAFDASSFSFNQRITALAPAESLTGFVALIDSSCIDSRFWDHVADGGGDIRIATDAAGTNQLPLDVVRCVSASSTLQIWVLLPTYSSAVELTLCAGSAGLTQPAPSSAYGSETVHSERAFCTHLDEAAELIDAAGNVTITEFGTVTKGVASPVGSGVSLPDDTNLQFTGDPYGAINSYTVSMWVNCPTAADVWQTFFSISNHSIAIGRRGGSNDLQIRHNNVEVRISGGHLAALYGAGWKRVTFSFDGTECHFFIDGNLIVSAAHSEQPLPQATELTITRLGAWQYSDTDGSMIGDLSEANYTRRDLSAEHIALETQNQNSPAVFWEQGEVTIGGGAALPAHTAQGSILAGGNTAIAKTKALLAAGGVLVGGLGQSLSFTAKPAHAAQGGILAGGNTAIAKTKALLAAGGVLVGGQAQSLSFTAKPTHAAQGGIVASGNAATAKTKALLAAGGVLVGGLGQSLSAKPSHAAQGGILAGGISKTLKLQVKVGAGGAQVGGSSNRNKIINFKAAGGANAGGTAVIQALGTAADQTTTKLQDLRAYLLARNPHLARNPEQLLTYVENGKISFHNGGQTGNYSHKYFMPATVAVTDFRGSADSIIIPVLEWLSVREPGHDPDETLSFSTNIIDSSTIDLILNIKITERVIVTFDGTTRTIKHVLPAPPQQLGAPLEIHVNGPAGGFVLAEAENG